MANTDRSLNFFVHVPKTAGSTINHYMSSYFNTAYSHCEGFIDNKKLFSERANEANYISGHVSFDKAQLRLGESTVRKVRYFSCMRQPKFQVMSHLNWLIEIQCRGKQFFYGHPINIQKISLEIRANGLRSTYDIMHLLLKYQGLFLNAQSRMILGTADSLDGSNIDKIIGDFEFIGTEKTLGILLEKITGQRINPTESINTSDYHFDTSLFEDEELQYFLRVHNANDLALYEKAKDS